MFEISDTALLQTLMAYFVNVTGTYFYLLKKILKYFTTFSLSLTFLIPELFYETMDFLGTSFYIAF